MRSNLASASPAAFTSADDEEFFGAIDRLTVSWGHVEIGREWLLHIVHQDLNGRERIGPEAPLSRQRKLRYLRRAFPTLAELQAFSARFAKLADARHAITTETILRAAIRANNIQTPALAAEVADSLAVM